MSETRRQYDPKFEAGAIRIVRETRRSVAAVAREPGIGAGTSGSWVREYLAEPRPRGQGLGPPRTGPGVELGSAAERLGHGLAHGSHRSVVQGTGTIRQRRASHGVQAVAVHD